MGPKHSNVVLPGGYDAAGVPLLLPRKPAHRRGNYIMSYFIGGWFHSARWLCPVKRLDGKNCIIEPVVGIGM